MLRGVCCEAWIRERRAVLSAWGQGCVDVVTGRFVEIVKT